MNNKTNENNKKRRRIHEMNYSINETRAHIA